MDLINLILLFGLMAVLAAVPSTSVVVVVARSVTHGLSNGAAAAAGIVTGDLLFVVLAIAGLAAITVILGDYFVIAKYLGGLYLIWFGVSLLMSRKDRHHPDSGSASLLRSYLAGLLLTLSDIKAVFFYASMFPAFVKVEQLGLLEMVAIASGTVIVVGAVKFGYAYAAHKASNAAKRGRYEGAVTTLAGGVSVGAGVMVLAKA